MMAPSAKTLLSRGDKLSIERGRLVIQPRSGKPVPPDWLKAHKAELVREILTALQIDAYAYCGRSEGNYVRGRAPGITLQYRSVVEGASAHVIFNVHLTRRRTTRAGKKGAPLPKGQFRIAPDHALYRFWVSTGLALPKRLGALHDYMGKLKDILVTAPMRNCRMNASLIQPLSISAEQILAAFFPDKARTPPAQRPDSQRTNAPDKSTAQTQQASAFQANRGTGEKGRGNTVISGGGCKGTSSLGLRMKKPEEQTIDEWTADLSRPEEHQSQWPTIEAHPCT